MQRHLCKHSPSCAISCLCVPCRCNREPPNDPPTDDLTCSGGLGPVVASLDGFRPSDRYEKSRPFELQASTFSVNPRSGNPPIEHLSVRFHVPRTQGRVRVSRGKVRRGTADAGGDILECQGNSMCSSGSASRNATTRALQN
jgi:hypothetical protein